VGDHHLGLTDGFDGDVSGFCFGFLAGLVDGLVGRAPSFVFDAVNFSGDAGYEFVGSVLGGADDRYCPFSGTFNDP